MVRDEITKKKVQAGKFTEERKQGKWRVKGCRNEEFKEKETK